MKDYFESKLHSVKKWPRVVRITVGTLLVLGGLVGFFPVLGFWMIPLGLVILAVDFRWARHALVNLKLRWRAWRRYRRRNNPKTAPQAKSPKPASRIRSITSSCASR